MNRGNQIHISGLGSEEAEGVEGKKDEERKDEGRRKDEEE